MQTIIPQQDIENLLTGIKKNAEKVTDWFDQNDMVCSGDKTKLIISGTRSNLKSKVEDKNIEPSVIVCGKVVKNSSSEKLLGVILNKNLTWKSHLYGNKEEIGLLKKLSKQVGMLKRVCKYLPAQKFNSAVSGIFLSKLRYCITVWGSVWKIPGDMNESKQTCPKMILESCRRSKTNVYDSKQIETAILQPKPSLVSLTPSVCTR